MNAEDILAMDMKAHGGEAVELSEEDFNKALAAVEAEEGGGEAVELSDEDFNKALAAVEAGEKGKKESQPVKKEEEGKQLSEEEVQKAMSEGVLPPSNEIVKVDDPGFLEGLKHGWDGIKGIWDDPTGEDGPLWYLTKNMLTGIGNATGKIVGGTAKGFVDLAGMGAAGVARAGETAFNALTNSNWHGVSDTIAGAAQGIDKWIDILWADPFILRGMYDGVAGAKEATGALNNIAEMGAGLGGIGAAGKIAKGAAMLKKGMDATRAAKIAHRATAAGFGLGGYERMAADEGGVARGGKEVGFWEGDNWLQEFTAMAGGLAEGAIFGLFGPLKKSFEGLPQLAEVTKIQAFRSFVQEMVKAGAAMGGAEATKQALMGYAGWLSGRPWMVDSGKTEKLEDGREVPIFTPQTLETAAKSTASQFAVGSGFHLAGAVKGKIGEAARYRIQENRKAYCPIMDRQARTAVALAADGRTVLSGGRGCEYVDEMLADGAVKFKDGSVWRPGRAYELRMPGGETVVKAGRATITVSDGTILDAETGTLAGYAPSGTTWRSVAAAEYEARAKNRRKDMSDAEARARMWELGGNDAGWYLAKPKDVELAEENSWNKDAYGELSEEGSAWLGITQMSRTPELAEAARAGMADVVGGRRTLVEVHRDLLAAMESQEKTMDAVRIAPEGMTEASNRPEGKLRNAGMLLESLERGELPVDKECEVKGLDATGTYQETHELEGEWDQAKAEPIIVWIGKDGSRRCVAGKSRLEAARKAGAKTIDAVYVREEDGWDFGDAQRLDAVQNLREGKGTAEQIFKGIDALGVRNREDLERYGIMHADMPAVLDALDFANLATEPVKEAMRNGTLDAETAGMIVKTLGVGRTGRNAERLQRIAVEKIAGKMSAEEAAGAMEELASRAAERGKIDLGDAKAVDDAIMAGRVKAVGEVRVASDAVAMETEDGKITTVGEELAGKENGERGTGNGERGMGNGERVIDSNEQRYGGTELDVNGGSVGCARFPNAKVRCETAHEPTVEGGVREVRTVVVEGLTAQEMLAPENRADAIDFMGRVAEAAGEMGFRFRDPEANAAAELLLRGEAAKARAAEMGAAEKGLVDAGQRLVDGLFGKESGIKVREGTAEEAAEVLGEASGNGKRPSIAGRKGAEQLGLGGAAEAEAMEKAGADSEEIWRKTGWWRGRDGKWRVELPPIAIDEQKLKQLDTNRDNYNFRKRKAQPEYHAPLEDLIADKQLVAKLNAAYGTLPHISVVEDVGWALGRFHPETNSIDIHRHLTAAEMRSVLEHELQHFIQHKEGFTGGGDKTGGEYQNLTGEVEARNVQKRLTMSPEERAATPPWATEDVPGDKQIVRYSLKDAAGQVKGWWDREKGEVVLMKGADIRTVAHEIGWHAVRQWAEKNSPELLSKMNEYAASCPKSLRKLIEKRYKGFTGEALIDEIGAGRFERELGDEFRKLLETRPQVRSWWQKVTEAIRKMLRGFIGKGDGIDLKKMKKMSPEEAMKWLAGQMMEGKGLAERSSASGTGKRPAIAGESGARNMGIKGAGDAKAMEEAGADREEIWRKTGWWKGKDGKWRFELPSVKMKSETEIETALREGVNNNWGGSSETTLEKVLDAPELFEAYPRLKRTKIVFSPDHDDKTGGWYNAAKNEIVLLDTGLKTLRHQPRHERDLYNTYKQVLESDEFLQKRLRNMDALGIEHGTAEEERELAKNWIAKLDKRIQDDNAAMVRNLVKERGQYSTLGKIVHEVQHAVQYLETFAKGGSPESAAEFVKKMKSKQRIWAYKLEVEETAKELGTTNPYEIEKAILEKLGVTNREQIAGLVEEGWIPDQAGRDKGYNLFARGYDKEGYEDAYNEYLGEMRKNGKASWWDGSPQKLYERLAGEVEARNASRREAMSPEERAATPPWETEDVPENRQIKRFSLKTGTAADYSWATLTAKPDMKLTQIDPGKFKNYTKDSERIEDARHSIVEAGGRIVGKEAVIEIEGSEVIVGANGIKHRGRRRNNENDMLFPVLGEVMKNAVRVNELEPRAEEKGKKENGKSKKDDKVTDVFVYLGAFAYGNEVCPVRIQISQYEGVKKLDRIDVLKSLNTKIGRIASPANTDFGLVGHVGSGPVVHLPDISIANLMSIAQPLHPEIFSRDVAANLGVAYKGDKIKARFSLEGREEAETERREGAEKALKGLLNGRRRVIEPVNPGAAESGEAGSAAGIEYEADVQVPEMSPSEDPSVAQPVAMGVSELSRMYRAITGNMFKVKGKSSTWNNARHGTWKNGKAWLAADVFGIVDRSDLEAIKEDLRKEGKFRHEDPQWAATHTKKQIEEMRDLSEMMLEDRITTLAEDRVHGKRPGGNRSAINAMAHEIGRLVCEMPVDAGAPQRLKDMHTLGKGIVDALAKDPELRKEAEAAAKWWRGEREQGNGEQGTAKKGDKELFAEMYGMFLGAPEAMRQRAPQAFAKIRELLSGNETLWKAYRGILEARASEGGQAARVMDDIRKQWDEKAQKELHELEKELDRPLGSWWTRAKATFLLDFHSTEAPAMLYIDKAVKEKLEEAKSNLKKGIIGKGEYEAILKDVKREKDDFKLATLTKQRGGGEGRLYGLEFVSQVLGDATRDGVKLDDLRTYMKCKRTIELQGRADSAGFTGREAVQVLEKMKADMGEAQYQRIEAAANRFRALREKHVLENPLIAEAFGQKMIDYWRVNASYVRSERILSAEEVATYKRMREEWLKEHPGETNVLADIEAMMDMHMAHSGGSHGETFMKRLEGSQKMTEDPLRATLENDLRIQEFARRNHYAVQLARAAKELGLDGFAVTKDLRGSLKGSKRYGTVSFLENGERKVLVMPKVVAEGFAAAAKDMNLLIRANRWISGILTQYSPRFALRNIVRNRESNNNNIAWMREGAVVTAAGVAGMRPVARWANFLMEQAAAHLPDRVARNALMNVLYGEKTNMYWVAQATRMAKLMTDPAKLRKRSEEADRLATAGKYTEAQQIMEEIKQIKKFMKMPIFAGMREMVEGKAGKSNLDELLGTLGFETKADGTELKGLKRLGAKMKRFHESVRRYNTFEEARVKIIALLAAERANMRAAAEGRDVRSAKEIAYTVATMSGSPRYENRGRAMNYLEVACGPFMNVGMKGAWRTIESMRMDPGAWWSKAAGRIAGRLSTCVLWMGGGYKVLSNAWRAANPGDEEANRAADALDRFGKRMSHALANCSDYRLRNYDIVPVGLFGKWSTFGIAMPRGDEDRLLMPAVDLLAKSLVDSKTAERCGFSKYTDMNYGVGEGMYATVFGSGLLPDISRTGIIWNFFRDVGYAWFQNPYNTFTQRTVYSQEDWDARYIDPWNFAKKVAKQGWRDIAGETILPASSWDEDEGQWEDQGKWAMGFSDPEDAGAMPVGGKTIFQALHSIPWLSAAASGMLFMANDGNKRIARRIDKLRQADMKAERYVIDKIANEVVRGLAAKGAEWDYSDYVSEQLEKYSLPEETDKEIIEDRVFDKVQKVIDGEELQSDPIGKAIGKMGEDRRFDQIMKHLESIGWKEDE